MLSLIEISRHTLRLTVDYWKNFFFSMIVLNFTSLAEYQKYRWHRNFWIVNNFTPPSSYIFSWLCMFECMHGPLTHDMNNMFFIIHNLLFFSSSSHLSIFPLSHKVVFSQTHTHTHTHISDDSYYFFHLLLFFSHCSSANPMWRLFHKTKKKPSCWGKLSFQVSTKKNPLSASKWVFSWRNIFIFSLAKMSKKILIWEFKHSFLH